MEITSDSHFRKVITIPLKMAGDDPKQYEHLHTKTIDECFEAEQMDDVQVYTVNANPVGIVVVYKDILKPNTVFYFSKKFDVERFLDDEKYRYSCQFFYWEDETGSHIRFASPYIDIIRTESVFKPLE